MEPREIVRMIGGELRRSGGFKRRMLGIGVRAMGSQTKLYESRAEDCTRAAEQTDDVPFREMLLLLALQWKLAAQEARRSQNAPAPR